MQRGILEQHNRFAVANAAVANHRQGVLNRGLNDLDVFAFFKRAAAGARAHGRIVAGHKKCKRSVTEPGLM